MHGPTIEAGEPSPARAAVLNRTLALGGLSLASLQWGLGGPVSPRGGLANFVSDRPSKGFSGPESFCGGGKLRGRSRPETVPLSELLR